MNRLCKATHDDGAAPCPHYAPVGQRFCRDHSPSLEHRERDNYLFELKHHAKAVIANRDLAEQYGATEEQIRDAIAPVAVPLAHERALRNAAALVSAFQELDLIRERAIDAWRRRLRLDHP